MSKALILVENARLSLMLDADAALSHDLWRVKLDA